MVSLGNREQAGELRSRRAAPVRGPVDPCEGYLRFALGVIFVLHRNYLLEKREEITLGLNTTSLRHAAPSLGQAGWP